MRILGIDIETRPHLGYFWGLFDQSIGINQLEQPTSVICFAAKWFGKKPVEFYSEHHHGKAEMVQQAHRLLDEADVVVHWNGKRFDIPHLNREFVELGLNPPSPYKQVDLMLAVRRQFKYASNKLQHVSTELGFEGKLSHSGFDLWRKCMAGDDKAWALMRRYNKQDVVLLEELHDRLLPWIPGYPNRALYLANAHNSADTCPRCSASNTLQRRGSQVTGVGKFQRFQCQACGGWSRSGKAIDRVDLREAS